MPAPAVCIRRGDALEVLLKVTPGARRDTIEAVVDDGHGLRRLALSVTAKAEGDAANRAVIRLVAKSWRVPPSAVAIMAGHRSRLKRLRLEIPPEKAMALERLLA